MLRVYHKGNPRMNKQRRICVTAAMLGLMLGGAAGQSRAALFVDIDARTEMISATINDLPVTPLPDSHDDFIHFNFDAGVIFDNNQSVSRDINLPVTLVYRGRLITAPTMGSSIIDVKFASAPETTPLEGHPSSTLLYRSRRRFFNQCK